MLFALHADRNRSVQPGPGCGMVAKASKSGKGGFGATRADWAKAGSPFYPPHSDMPTGESPTSMHYRS
jgi:hypothetical protein